jgi:DnaJ-domain-containing protein 1
MSAMLGAIAFLVVDSPLDAPPVLFGGGTTKAEAAQKRQRKQERRRQERRRNSSPAKLSAAQALEILGLKAGATEQEIRAAYIHLMKRVHPDLSQTFLPHNLMR